MSLLLLSFIAGCLTVLSPCVISLLPVIIAGSLKEKDKSRPYIVIASLAVSVLVFTLLLKVSSSLINIPPEVWTTISGGILIILGLITLFPVAWDNFSLKLGLANKSDELLNKSNQRKGVLGSILVGASLGPVFSSCSPTYAIIVATVLPVDLATGILYLILYCLGLSLMMLLIAVFGQRIIGRFKWAVNPNGKFKKILGIMFVIIGVLTLTGLDKKVQLYLAQNGFIDATLIENQFLQGDQTKMFNVEEPYQAPELTGVQNWINSNPITVAELKGKVVLIDFWTYSCINCVKNTPYLNDWYSKYKDMGFEIIGVHAPEFQFEKDVNNVQKAVTEFGIKYPVVLDNDKATWDAYKNQYWPAKYFIDATGKVRHTHFGEGEYALSEEVIRQLLRENGKTVFSTATNNDDVPITSLQTPETYLGYARFDTFANYSEVKYNQKSTYNNIESLDSNFWSLKGDWNLSQYDITSESDTSVLKINFSAKDVYLVMGSENQANVELYLNGLKLDDSNKGDDVTDSNINVNDSKLYKLIHFDEFKSDQLLELRFKKGVKANAFTFGS